MDIQQIVYSKLHEIHRSRGRVGIILSLFFILASTFFQNRLFADDVSWIVVLAVIGVALLIRGLMIGLWFKPWSEGRVWAYWVNAFGFFLFGLGWGLHFYDVYIHYGANSPNVSYALLIVMGYVSSTTLTLVGDRTSYYTFVTTVALVCLLTYLQNPAQQGFVMVFIVLYYIFCLGNFRVAHRQMLELIHSDIKSEGERKRLINVMNSVPGHVTLYDKDLICYMANQTTLKLIPNIIGKKLGSITGGTWEQVVLDFFYSGKNSETKEHFSNQTGKDIWYLLNTQRMSDGGVILVAIETTELALAQKAVRDQEAKTQYTAKLVSLGEMAAGIAHEVNNPLTIIQGSAHIIDKLTDSTPLDLESIKMLSRKMVDTSDRIAKIVRSLKSLSRNGERDPMTFLSTATIIDKCLDICRQRFLNNSIELILPEEMDFGVKGREVQLGQVLLNLLNNTIDAVKNLEEKWVEIKIVEEQKWVDILVIDSGNGIPEHLQKKIMEPFFTTKEVNQGTGLGLSISKTIMQEHEGELSLLPEEAHTTFRMRLPREG